MSLPTTIIGKAYKYHPFRDTIFVVKSFTEHRVIFECGHWCSDLVFMDMFDIKERKFNYNLLTPCTK